jgi:hypothetical protein
MSRAGMFTIALGAWLAITSAGRVPGAEAQESGSQSWTEQKCARYRQAWADVQARRGVQGIGQEFLERHEAFLASGCTAKVDVCPRSSEELDLANLLTVAAMNAGTASTFLPFACPRK